MTKEQKEEIFIVPNNQQEGSRQDRLMALVRKPATQEKIDLGYPEQAAGQIRSYRIRNYFWMGAAVAAPAAIVVDGALRAGSGMLNSGLPITEGLAGLGEIAVGLISAATSSVILLGRENLFLRINEALSAKTSAGIMQNLDIHLE